MRRLDVSDSELHDASKKVNTLGLITELLSVGAVGSGVEREDARGDRGGGEDARHRPSLPGKLRRTRGEEWRRRGDEHREQFQFVYAGVLRDLGLAPEEVDAFLAAHRAEVDAAIGRRPKKG
jgi:hypothetical protein